MKVAEKDLRLLRLLTVQGVTAGAIAFGLNQGIPQWMFWRRWNRVSVFVHLMGLEERNLAQSHTAFCTRRGRLWTRTHSGSLAVMEADRRRRIRTPKE